MPSQLIPTWPLATLQRDQPSDAQKLYDSRSAHYDESWHPRFACHVIELIAPQPGETVLDLACGTGLVTFHAARAVRPSGKVTAIDISTGMLAQAKQKHYTANVKNVQFFQHSITDLASLDAIQGEKYDVITCVSALVLLPNAAEALKQWMDFLKPGGRLITDVPHPRCQLGFVTLERVGNALGRPVPSYRVPFEQPGSLQAIMEDAGLTNIDVRLLSQQDRWDEDEQGDEYQPQELKDFICDLNKPVLGDVYSAKAKEADAMFDRLLQSTYGECLAGDDVRADAKQAFRLEWSQLVSGGTSGSGGGPKSIEEIDGVYVGIGLKAMESETVPASVLGKRKSDETEQSTTNERLVATARHPPIVIDD